jgi:Nif-specific regulatory protein
VLVEYFVRLEEERSGKTYLFSNEALKALNGCRWEGNVRELRTEIELLLETNTGCVLGLEHLPRSLRQKAEPEPIAQVQVPSAEANKALVDETLWALRRHNGNKTLAARELGITRQALHKRLKKLGGVTTAELQA